MVYWQLFFIFSYVSIIGFGGGTAMIPLFESLLVDKWISSQDLMDIIALSQVTPGAFSINLATYTGYIATSRPYLGALSATLGHCVVGFFMCTAIGKFLKRHAQLPIIQVIFNTLRPMTTALLIWTAFLITYNDLSRHSSKVIPGLLIIIFSFFLLRYKPLKYKTGPIGVILLGGFFALIAHSIYTYFMK
ncbi:MAG: chromate transporter [Spirochaetia bacterium]